MKYEIITIGSFPVGQELIRRTNQNGVVWFIPTDEANADYQQYLEWVAEGNEPEVIDD